MDIEGKTIRQTQRIRLSGDEAVALVEALQSFVGHEIVISEGITRERGGRGYDRHAATNSRFSFMVDQVFGYTISGELFGIESKGGSNFYCLSFLSVVQFEWQEGILTITEHYEDNTARQTVVQRIAA
ncbi:MAG: hypothetical protein ABIY70_04205 [Capsulimonas sp.]|uniref:hypothetical protein n=1 Tax=Capsulimonas sp. TaxID=2494211 RepID=UPI00326418E7